MPLSPETLVRSLFSKQQYLESATQNFTEAERELLKRPADAPLTEADVPLLDEAAELLGDFSRVTGAAAAARAEAEHRANLENASKALENVHQTLADIGADGVVTAEQIAALNEAGINRMTAAAAAQADRTWAYGHIVVDEAQELSPMQWRLLMRRCPMKSFTVVGDIAQASSASAASSWSQALEPFVGERFTLEELTINYRTPAQIADAAVAVAREADCGIHLDVNNIYVNAVNHGLLSPEAFLENVDAERVCYIHIAGHDVETPELLIDTHGAAVLPTVWDLLELAYTKLPTIPPTLLERDFNFPPFAELEAEVAKIAEYQTRAGKEYRRAS